jgi:transposase
VKHSRRKQSPSQSPSIKPDPQLRVVELERELAWARLRIQMLEETLRQERIQKLGPKSETLTNLQLQLLADEEPGATLDEVEAEAKREPVNALQPRERKSKHPGRARLPEHLKRVEQIIRCEDGNCQACGNQTEVIGYDESERLEVEPAKYYVRVTLREKRACRHCAESTVRMAPLAPSIIEKSVASDAVVVDTIVKKYSDHLPLYRQAVILEREAGIEMSRVTLDGWVMRVGEMLIPIVDVMRKNLLTSPYLQADETTVPVQTSSGSKPGQNHVAYLWQYGKPGGETVFDFRMGREREGPLRFLGSWEGILQTDGYQAYEGVGGPKMVHVGCWAHARRKFVDAVKVNERDGEAAKMVVRMDALFLVDREARDQSISAESRLALRREHSRPWLDEIRAACLFLAGLSLPQGALAKACRYTLNMWKKLERCLEHDVELSNNIAENSMRPVALGRKNWLQVGSEKAGPKVAAILSVVESCRRLKVSVREYLADVLPGLDRRPLAELPALTPEHWASRRP